MEFPLGSMNQHSRFRVGVRKGSENKLVLQVEVWPDGGTTGKVTTSPTSNGFRSGSRNMQSPLVCEICSL